MWWRGMRSDLPQLSALLSFETVARRLSFARAADELNLTPSAVSHQIANLEQFLGVLLFERTSRGIALSDAGEAYLKRVAGAIGAIGAGAPAVLAGTVGRAGPAAGGTAASVGRTRAGGDSGGRGRCQEGAPA